MTPAPSKPTPVLKQPAPPTRKQPSSAKPTPPEQATPALDVDELVVELAPQERKVWDDLDDASQADLLKEIQGLPDKPTQLKNRLRKQRLSRGRGRGPDDETIHADGETGPLTADREAPDKALLEATTPADVLEALARITWLETHDGKECEGEQIPTEADLCQERTLWTFSRPSWPLARGYPLRSDLLDKVRSRLLLLNQFKGLSPHPKDGSGMWDLYTTDFNGGRLEFTYRLNPDRPPFFGCEIEDIQAAWKATPRDLRPLHPLAPTVAAWQARPKTTEPFRPKHKANLTHISPQDPTATST